MPSKTNKITVREIMRADECANAGVLIMQSIYKCKVTGIGCHTTVECPHFKKKPATP